MQLSADHLSALSRWRDRVFVFSKGPFADSIYQELIAGGFIICHPYLSDPETVYFELTPTGTAVLKLLESTGERSEPDDGSVPG